MKIDMNLIKGIGLELLELAAPHAKLNGIAEKADFIKDLIQISMKLNDTLSQIRNQTGEDAEAVRALVEGRYISAEKAFLANVDPRAMGADAVVIQPAAPPKPVPPKT